MMPYDQQQLRDLLLRAKTVLGSEESQTLGRSTPRRQAFSTALNRAIKAMGSPEQVTDEQILGAMQIAHEVLPVELETLSTTSSPQTSEPSMP